MQQLFSFRHATFCLRQCFTKAQSYNHSRARPWHWACNAVRAFIFLALKWQASASPISNRDSSRAPGSTVNNCTNCTAFKFYASRKHLPATVLRFFDSVCLTTACNVFRRPTTVHSLTIHTLFAVGNVLLELTRVTYSNINNIVL